MSEIFRSISVPVKATQWKKEGDHDKVVQEHHDSFKLLKEYGSTEVNESDWIVEFATGEIHVVRDSAFKLRFEKTNSFTKKELSAAVNMALQGDCV